MLNWELHIVLHNVKLGAVWKRPNLTLWSTVWKRPNLKLWSAVWKRPNLILWSAMWKRPNLTLWSTLWIYRYSQCENAPILHCGALCESIVIHNVKTPQFNIVEHTVNLSLFTMWKRPNLILWSTLWFTVWFTLWNSQCDHTVNLSLFTMWKRPNLTLWTFTQWNAHHTVKHQTHCETPTMLIWGVFTLWHIILYEIITLWNAHHIVIQV